MSCPHCPHCAAISSGSDVVDMFRTWCRDNGHDVRPDNRVSETTAAALLRRSKRTLEGWAYGNRCLPFVSIRGRRLYRIEDLAAFNEDAEK